MRSGSVHELRHAFYKRRVGWWESGGSATLGRIQGRRSFTFGGRRFRYHSARYNTTWANERTVELPIALALLPSARRVLEVGNVLRHYEPALVDQVVDRYEIADGVENVDVLDYRAAEPFDLIVSISTFEHVGFDEDVQEPDKTVRALEHLRGLLAPGGTLLVTVPLGYNPHLDAHVREGRMRFNSVGYLKRISRDNRWREVSEAETAGARYGNPYPKGNVLAVGTVRA